MSDSDTPDDPDSDSDTPVDPDYRVFEVKWEKNACKSDGGNAVKNRSVIFEPYSKWRYEDNQLYKRCKKCKLFKLIEDYDCELTSAFDNCLHYFYHYANCVKCRTKN